MDLRNHAPVSADGKAVSAWREQPASAAAEILAARVPLVVTLAIFALAFLLPAWPWLSGAVTIPWDAKSQFFPQVQFLAGSLARGEWPWWSPNVFAGWAEISDPQSLLFSPLHVLLAAFNPVVSLRAFDAVTFAYLFLGGVGIILFFRDRGWHAGGALVAAMAFALAGSANARMQHTGQIISVAYLPLVLWLGARALERSSWRAGLAAGALTGLMAIGRDQVALLSLYVLAGFVLAHWLMGAQPLARMRASITPLTAAVASGSPPIEPLRSTTRHIAVPGLTHARTRSRSTSRPPPLAAASAMGSKLAATEEARMTGLMFRRELPEGRGMLFDFKQDTNVSMWMKNTYIPLDMLFIRADGRIQRIAENTEPQSEKIIPAGAPVRAVLEVIGGTARKLGIRAGDRVAHPMFRGR